ncbi:MAG: hypothetical protein GHCLOJNM_01560 [bacterium]|nr:hypothetical protein [bacterium]
MRELFLTAVLAVLAGCAAPTVDPVGYDPVTSVLTYPNGETRTIPTPVPSPSPAPGGAS